MLKENENSAAASTKTGAYLAKEGVRKSLDALAAERPKAHAILAFIMENMKGHDALVCPYAVFQRELGMSLSTVKRHIGYLNDHGYLCIYRFSGKNMYMAGGQLEWEPCDGDEDDGRDGDAGLCVLHANILSLPKPSEEVQGYRQMSANVILSLSELEQ